jgi:hypothetical protein
MKRKSKKSNTVRNALIVLVIIAFFVMVLAASYRSEQKQQEAADYFKITDAEYVGTLEERGQLLKVSELRFKITAVKGDAHEVMVQAGGSNMEEGLVGTGTILKGQTETAYLMLPTIFQVPIDDDGKFPIEIHVASVEAYGIIYAPLVP